MQKIVFAVFAGLALAVNLAAADVRVNPHLEELLARLNLDLPGLAKVKAAATPAEQQQALLDYFRGRKNIPALEAEEAKTPPDSKRDRDVADQALKHIFPGQRAYPPQPRGEPIDWDTSPFPDKEWLWQFHRFGWWGSLGKTYLATKDEAYAKEWAAEVNSWVEHMHSAKNFRRHTCWRSLEVGIRMLVWPQAFERFIQSPSVDSYTLVNFLWSLYCHAEQIDAMYPPKGKEPERVGNFDITQQDGLLTVAGMFPEFKESPTFAKNAVERLIRFQQQVMLPDGVISEYVPSYHMAYPRQFQKAPKFCARYGIKANFPPEYLDRVAKGVYAVVIWSHPDGTSPLFGDAWLGSPGGNNEYVGRFLEDFNRPDFRYFATRGAEGVAPAGKIHQLPDAGYTTIRSDWSDKALFAVVKNTNPSRHQWHSHFDNLSFELSAFGRRFMTDSGCYNYSGEPEWRAWFRRPQAHQMVTLDDLPVNSRGKTVFTKSVPGLDAAVLENEVNAGLTQRRSFILVENRFFIVLDELKGAATGTLQAHFQLDPAPWQLDPKRLAARTMYGDGPNLVVKGAALPGVELVEEEGWFSPKYMEKTQRPAFAFVQPKPDDKPRYFLTLLAPLPKERQLYDAKVAFFRDGKPTVEPGNEIYVRLNYSEHFLITLDPAAGTLALKKGQTEPYDRAETQLFNTGSWQEPPVPAFSAAVESKPAKANDSSPRLRIDIFNDKGSQVTYRDLIAPPGGGTSPVTWGAPESRKFGTIMQSPPLAAEKQELTFSFVPEADGVLKVSFLGNDVKLDGKRQELWAEFSGVTFDGALNAAELAKANAAPRQVWHQKPYTQLVKVKKGEQVTIKCRAGIPEKK